MNVQYTSGLGTYISDQSNSPQIVPTNSLIDFSTWSGRDGQGSTTDVANISERAKLLSGLAMLSQNNPGQFQKSAANIAQQLDSAARTTTDIDQFTYLRKTAASFEKASQSGDFDELMSQPMLSASHISGEDLKPVMQVFSAVLPQLYKEIQSSAS